MESTGGSPISVASSTALFGVLIGFSVGAGISSNEKLDSLRSARGNVDAGS